MFKIEIHKKLFASAEIVMVHMIIIIYIRGHSKSMFAQDSRVLTPTPPLFALVRFQAPSVPLHPQGTFVLARPHPLTLIFYTCEI